MDAVSPTVQNAQATAQSTQTSASASALASDFETFLTLLTAQLKNQDPLAPQDSTEFVAQLASFSSVEQQIQSNDTLQQILGYLDTGGLNDAASWLGAQVLAPGAVDFNGDLVAVEFDIPAGSSEMIVTITDDFGQEVGSFAHQAGTAFEWLGLGQDGEIVPDGPYTFTAVANDPDGQPLAAEGQSFSTVTEIRSEAGQAVFITENGARLSVENLTALRSPVVTAL